MFSVAPVNVAPMLPIVAAFTVLNVAVVPNTAPLLVKELTVAVPEVFSVAPVNIAPVLPIVAALTFVE